MTDRQLSLARLSPFKLGRCFVCALTVVLVAVAANSQTPLQVGASITAEISAGESNSYEFWLQRDQLIQFTLSTQDLNLRMHVVAADGNTLAEVVHRRYGSLTWTFIAPQHGKYKLNIFSLEQGPPRRHYQLSVDRLKMATEYERKAHSAAASFFRAEVLRLKADDSNLTRAIEDYRSAAAAWQRIRNWGEAAGAWQQIGEVHFSRGSYQEALRAFEKASQLSERSGDGLLTLEQQARIGYVQIYLGNLEEASEFFDRCRKTLGKLKDVEVSRRERFEAQLQNNYGEIENSRGNLKGSLVFFGRALAQWTRVGDRQGMALAHLNSGHSYFDSGSVDEVASEFDQALRLWREIGDRRGEALTLTAQGNLFSLLGDNYAALTAHREARDIFRRIGDQQGEAVTSNGLGKVFEDLNRKREATDEYSLALRLNHSIGNRAFEAVSAYYLGRVWRDLGDLPKALDFYTTSLALSRKAGKSRMATLALMDIAGIYVKQRKLDVALGIYKENLAFYKNIADLRRQAFTHQGLGELLRLRDQTESAMQEYRLALELFQRIKDPQGQAESLYWLARLSQDQGRLNEAMAASEESIKIIEIQRARVIGQNWRSSYFASVRRHFELYVDILMQLDSQKPGQGFAALALAASERAKARSLVELLNETQSEIRRGVDPALLARERQLRHQLSAAAAYQTKTLNGPHRETESAEIELKIRNLNTEYDTIQAQIKAQSPAYEQLSQPSALNLSQIQADLKQDRDTILIEYMLGDERSYAWLVTPDGLVTRELPGRQTLEALATEVYQSITARQQHPNEDAAKYHERYTAAEQRFCPSSSRLTQLLLDPFKSLLNRQRLLIVADGSLQYIPFDALPLPAENDSAKVCRPDAPTSDYFPVLTAHEVVHLPSFSCLATLRRIGSASRPAREVAVWADPVFESDDSRIAAHLRKPILPLEHKADVIETTQVPPTRLLASGEEAQSVMRFAPAGASMLLTGFAANRESTLNRNLQDYRILHFATHSIVNSRYPSLTGLLLSTVDERGQAQNGLLQLHDIYSLRLNADLVVLSGCQTGLGEQLSGEGLVGLTQGFLYAGSRSVVVSLWDVQDKSTANLMANFYQAMLEDGAAPAEALHQAKLAMYQRGESRPPFYWSAFIIQGEYRSPPGSWLRVFQSQSLWSVFILSSIMAWLFWAWYKRRRQPSK